MSNIGIRDIASIGIANIDVYHTNNQKNKDIIPKNAIKLKLRIGVFFDGTGNNGYNSDAVYYKHELPNFKKFTYLFLTLLTFFLTSCQYDGIPKDRFNWDAAYSAPKYYPIGGARVDFGNAGMSSITNFDNGWGDNYGAVSSAEKYKKLPTEVFITYVSAVENMTFEGTVTLPYKKIEKLFNQYIKNKKTESAKLLVGMAPGGWIRVWAYFHTDNGVTDNIEILKTQLKGFVDPSINEEFTNKNDPYWEKWNTYWNHFGIPYEVWENNEKEYNLFFNFFNPNPDYEIIYQYSSKDGTIEWGIHHENKHQKLKLPADLILKWWNKNDTISYDTHVFLPNNFSKHVERKKTKDLELTLEIEKNEEYGVLYLITNGNKEKILRFKNKFSKSFTVGDSDFSKEVECFIK
jgi:hypothetical protein